LRKQEYLGHTVNFRIYKDGYKDKQQKFRPEEEWLMRPTQKEENGINKKWAGVSYKTILLLY